LIFGVNYRRTLRTAAVILFLSIFAVSSSFAQIVHAFFGRHVSVEDFTQMKPAITMILDENSTRGVLTLVFFEEAMSIDLEQVSRRAHIKGLTPEIARMALEDESVLQQVYEQVVPRYYWLEDSIAEKCSETFEGKFVPEFLNEQPEDFLDARLFYIFREAQTHPIRLYFERPSPESFEDLLRLILMRRERRGSGRDFTLCEFQLEERVRGENRERDIARLIAWELQRYKDSQAVVVFGSAHHTGLVEELKACGLTPIVHITPQGRREERQVDENARRMRKLLEQRERVYERMQKLRISFYAFLSAVIVIIGGRIYWSIRHKRLRKEHDEEGISPEPKQREFPGFIASPYREEFEPVSISVRFNGAGEVELSYEQGSLTPKQEELLKERLIQACKYFNFSVPLTFMFKMQTSDAGAPLARTFKDRDSWVVEALPLVIEDTDALSARLKVSEEDAELFVLAVLLDELLHLQGNEGHEEFLRVLNCNVNLRRGLLSISRAPNNIEFKPWLKEWLEKYRHLSDRMYEFIRILRSHRRPTFEESGVACKPQKNPYRRLDISNLPEDGIYLSQTNPDIYRDERGLFVNAGVNMVVWGPLEEGIVFTTNRLASCTGLVVRYSLGGKEYMLLVHIMRNSLNKLDSLLEQVVFKEHPDFVQIFVLYREGDFDIQGFTRAWQDRAVIIPCLRKEGFTGSIAASREGILARFVPRDISQYEYREVGAEFLSRYQILSSQVHSRFFSWPGREVSGPEDLSAYLRTYYRQPSDRRNGRQCRLKIEEGNRVLEHVFSSIGIEIEGNACFVLSDSSGATVFQADSNFLKALSLMLQDRYSEAALLISKALFGYEKVFLKLPVPFNNSNSESLSTWRRFTSNIEIMRYFFRYAILHIEKDVSLADVLPHSNLSVCSCKSYYPVDDISPFNPQDAGQAKTIDFLKMALDELNRIIDGGSDLCLEDVLRLHSLLYSGAPESSSFRTNEVCWQEPPLVHLSPDYIEFCVGHVLNLLCSNADHLRRGPLELAAVVYFSFLHIHPFFDGNKRLAFIMLNYALLKEGLFPLVITPSNYEEFMSLADKPLPDILNFLVYYVEADTLDAEDSNKEASTGFFGNLSQEHIQDIEALIEKGDFSPVDEFNRVLEEFEGTPVRFFLLPSQITRAPPEGFIWARLNEGVLEVYFSSFLIERLANDFSDSLQGILECISLHELREIGLIQQGRSSQDAHREAKEEAERLYPQVYARLEGLMDVLQTSDKYSLPSDFFNYLLEQESIKHRIIPEGDVIIRQGENGRHLYVIVRGSVKVCISSEGEQRDICTLREGDCFGEMAFFTRLPRTANIVAQEETEVLEIEPSFIERVDREYGGFSFLSFLSDLSRRRLGDLSQFLPVLEELSEASRNDSYSNVLFGLSLPELAYMALRGRRVAIDEPGASIIREGDTSGDVFILLKGSLGVAGTDSPEGVVISPGGIVGEMSAICRERSPGA